MKKEWPEAQGLDKIKADSQSERKRRIGETEKGRNNKEIKAIRRSKLIAQGLRLKAIRSNRATPPQERLASHA
jgi:hypothetical protein